MCFLGMTKKYFFDPVGEQSPLLLRYYRRGCRYVGTVMKTIDINASSIAFDKRIYSETRIYNI